MLQEVGVFTFLVTVIAVSVAWSFGSIFQRFLRPRGVSDETISALSCSLGLFVGVPLGFFAVGILM